MSENTEVYAEDCYAWTQQQAALLRVQKTQGLAFANLAEEIESLGHSDKRELGNRLQILVKYLLQWRYQPEGYQESHSWEKTIWHQRTQLALLLEESTSLHRELPARLTRRDAAQETRLPW